MKRTSTRTNRKIRTASKPASVPAQAPAAEDSRADIYQRITDRIAAAIEAGAGEWRMPWHPGADGATPRLPVNAVTGKPYRGINTVVLWATAQAEGYPSAVWATYRQWQELGAQVRKGEQSPGRPEGFHLQPPTEPCVNLSIYTARPSRLPAALR